MRIGKYELVKINGEQEKVFFKGNNVPLTSTIKYIGNGNIICNSADWRLVNTLIKNPISFMDLSRRIAKKEGKKKSLGIAQIKEVLSIVRQELAKENIEDVIQFIYNK